MAHDTVKGAGAPPASVAFQYRREQVAKQMAGVYLAFGASASQGKAAMPTQQSQTRTSEKQKG